MTDDRPREFLQLSDGSYVRVIAGTSAAAAGWRGRTVKDVGGLVYFLLVVGGADAGNGYPGGVGQVDQLVGPGWVNRRP